MQRLPTETLTSIFRHFCLHCAHPEGHDAYFRCRPGRPQQPDDSSWYSVEYRKPLHALCLVSRSLRDIVQPILFHEFILGYGDSWRSTQYSWDRRLTSFFQTVIDRRDLAAEVQRLFLHPQLQDCSELEDVAVFEGLRNLAASLGFKLSGALRPSRKPTSTSSGPVRGPPPVYHAPDGALKELVEAYLIECSCPVMPNRDERISDYISSSEAKQRYRLTAALFAILVTQLPNLQRLSFQPSLFHNEVISQATLRSVHTSALSRLQTLDISTRDWTAFFNLFSEARAMLTSSAASLTTLNLHMCDTFWSEARSSPPPNLSGLKHIHLTRCRLTEKQLQKLLSSCSSGLQAFVFEAAYPYDGTWWDSYEHFQPSDAVTHLGAHEDTLKSLHLDLRARGRRKPHSKEHKTDGGHIHPISSLERFTALEHLLINSSSICGSSETSDMEIAAGRRQPLVAILPPNIIALDIVGYLGVKDSPHLVQGLIGLAESLSRGQFERLKQVRCDSSQEIDEHVASLFGAHGVNFSQQEWPLSESTVDIMDVPEPLRYVDYPLPDESEDEDL